MMCYALTSDTFLTCRKLSQNYLTGPISPFIANLTRLQYLDLGINAFSGLLPRELGKLNNLLALEQPWGLYCLQNGFPCKRGSGRYSDFAIKCGGPMSTLSNQVVYDREDEDLGPASYFVTGTGKWAVSNVGVFAGSHNETYVSSQLFQTARVSPGSLRYYGLDLQNGKYNVLLQFIELEIASGMTWQSSGRRVFDIFIQGTCMEKDFNIQNEVSGSYTPVERNYTVWVTNNFLEIHLYWAGKGTCCIPIPGTYGPSISAISVTPLFKPRSMSSNSKRATVIAVTVVPLLTVVLLCIAAGWFIQRKKQSQATEDELLGIDAKLYTFSYAELKSATSDFNKSSKLGEGGFGPVFKGTLNDGRPVAVKQLSVASHQGRNQFIAEIATISEVQHRNLVKLYGCCIDGEKRLLVYEYLENRSLDKVLFRNTDLKLNWANRFEICVGVARGLAYLHHESRLRIVHRDVKASNILLDSAFIPKISDFGLAKLYDDKMTHISTGVAGTIGYLAPEYAMRGHLTEKADVFAYGIVALEIVSGRSIHDSNMDEEKMYLLEWAWDLHDGNKDVELVDKTLVEFN